MNRFAEYIVFSGFRTAWRFASWPTRRSPVFVKATTDGVRRLPSLFVITVGLPPSITATTEFVVPRSIPTAFAMAIPPDQQRFVSTLAPARSAQSSFPYTADNALCGLYNR